MPSRTLRNEINPYGICEMHCVREICLTASEMPAGVGGFNSFHVEQSEIFHNVR